MRRRCSMKAFVKSQDDEFSVEERLYIVVSLVFREHQQEDSDGI